MSEPSAAPRLDFRGGPLASVVPIAVFLIGAVGLVIAGAPVVEGMIMAAMAGISAGMVFARSMADYSEQSFTLMANRVATVAVVCWLWAGAFSGILGESGLVEAMVWVGWKLNLTGPALVVAVFLSAALFAVSVGTGMGTVIGFTAVMYPAGVFLGAEPAALIGAILSGAALGDNLAPISDTTIVSAATQETDVAGVVRSRIKYVVIAASVACLLFLITGTGSQAGGEDSSELLAGTADPKGLPMLIPAFVVFVVALSGRHFLAALTAGVVTAILVGWASGIFPLRSVFHVTTGAQPSVGGSAVTGALGLMPTAILTLLLVTAIGIMQAGGFLDRVIAWLRGVIGTSLRRVEFAIVGLVSFTNVCVSVNTVAMITAGPLANVLRRDAGIHPNRSANLLDTISCSFPYVLPYAATAVTIVIEQQKVAARYPTVPVIGWSEFVPYYFYGHVLLAVMILAVLTGFGRKQG